MKICAFITATCKPNRIEFLRQSITYLDSQNFPFYKKIISFDHFDNYTLSEDLKHYCLKNNWTINIDFFKSRTKSMLKFIDSLDEDIDFIFYTEDDIKVNLPKISIVEKILSHKDIKGRECGIFSLNMGGNRYSPEEFGDLKFIEKNLIQKYDDSIVFTRLEEWRNDYFVEFPALFINKQLFIDIFRHSQVFFKDQIERSLTSSYFMLKKDQNFFKCSSIKADTINILKNNPFNFKDCINIILLDANQGSGADIGNSNF